ncbi:MAG: hypothetical protein ACOYD9_07655 [Pyramidobacter sp.]
MADGFESARTEAWFNGQIRPGKLPKRRRKTSPEAANDVELHKRPRRTVSEAPDKPQGDAGPVSSEKDDGTAD